MLTEILISSGVQRQNNMGSKVSKGLDKNICFILYFPSFIFNKLE